MAKQSFRLPRSLAVLAIAASIACPSHAQVSIANGPLFLTPSVDPNLMFILDDSGSMQWEIMPDSITYTYYLFPRPSSLYGGSVYDRRIITFSDTDIANVHVRSSHNNTVFYNPEITYSPWVNHDGTVYLSGNTATAAHHNPANTGLGTINLTASQTHDRWRRWTGTQWEDNNTSTSFRPITFYQYKGSGNTFTPSNYVKYQIRGTNGYSQDLNGGSETAVTSFTWGNGITRTVAQEAQNFANWYTFYRSRILAARAGIGKAFAQQPENLRVGFGAINSASQSVDNVSTQTIISGVRPFSGANRSDFFSKLYTHTIPTSGTPLRRALDDAGQYYSRTDSRGPWSTTPGASGGTDLSCRQSYTILMTDGYWNGDQASTEAARANVDNSAGPTITSPSGAAYQYTAADPFRDDWSNTLADVAMYYWSRDLRTGTGMPNNVPTSVRNPAFWQHMVTFGIGLGVSGSINPSDAWSALSAGAAINWPQPSADAGAANIDDLLHAAVNSRGGFFSASDPDTFANELSAVLAEIGARVEDSATSAAASSAVLQANTLLYTAGFRSGDWSGELKAYTLDANGNRNQLAWDAEARLRANPVSDRRIFTKRSDTGATVALNNLTSLSTAQQTALSRSPAGTADSLAGARLAWLRGSEHASLRSRISPVDGQRLLGDIIGSNPQFIGKRNFGYRMLPGAEGASYDTYRASPGYRNRPDMLALGANDGMLHVFDASTGNELFAYMPSELLLPEGSSQHARINELMDSNYAHRYFVDGEAAIGDAYWGGSWKTVLVGTMGAGGRTVFALDISDPTNFSAANVLWEYKHNELGYGVGQPVITRVRTGANSYEWVAIFGNGYNSQSHKAMLFVVRLSDGALLGANTPVPIDTGQGTAAAPNGLASPVTTDWPTMDLTTRYVYAGDLHGRLWRFNLSGNNPGNWNQSGNKQILFQAQDAGGTAQPITARPTLAVHPTDPTRLVVLFGTGSYFRTGDASLANPQVQTIYGIFDTSSTTGTVRSDLLQQTITWQQSLTFNDGDEEFTVLGRKVSQNALTNNHKGWYLDLIFNGIAEGERVISPPTFPSGIDQRRVRFTTLIPDNDPCGYGRRGFVFDLNLVSGARTTTAVFDLNRDGLFTAGDLHEGDAISAIGGSRGERLTVIRDGDSSREFLLGGQDKVGDGFGAAELLGRKSWRQLR